MKAVSIKQAGWSDITILPQHTTCSGSFCERSQFDLLEAHAQCRAVQTWKMASAGIPDCLASDRDALPCIA